MKKDKIDQILKGLIEMFESGDMPQEIAKAVIKRQEGSSPSDEWSIGNLILRTIAGTDDARGFKQWKEVGRSVKRGSKAFYILAPCTRKITKENKDGEEENITIITGFRAVPVFRYEDTEGESLPKVNYEPPVLPPLVEVADAWDIKIKYGPFTGRFYGYYNFGKDEIFLATPDASTFFHELGHAAHKRVLGLLKNGQDAEQEIVAEMTSAVLCQLYGYKNRERYSYRYISNYSEGRDVIKSVMKVLSDIEKCLNLILTTASNLRKRKETA